MIHKYVNGNYTVEINDATGTKTRWTEEDRFISKFPESIDCTITYKCDGECKFCYANCTSTGKHADLDSDYINNVFIPSLKPYTEIALNGNDLSHPQLYSFLQKLKDHDVIANITVNQKHFLANLDYLHRLYDNKLIHGLGVSLTDPNLRLVAELQKFPTAVLHVVAGVVTTGQLNKLKNHGIKLLILGYKDKGRGVEFYKENAENVSNNIKMVRTLLPTYIKDGFDVISFDNLAIEQLHVKDLMTESEWNEFYMGDDGQFTFFVDLVNKTFAKDSLTDAHFAIDNRSIDDMFDIIKTNLQ